MLEASTTISRTNSSAGSKQHLATWGTSLVLFALALVPRAALSVTFFTVDEVYNWIPRSERLLAALRAGEYLQTIQSGHPGVTTMWCGALGALLHELLVGLGVVASADPDLRWALMRLPVAVVAAASIAVSYPLMLRLFGRTIALLAAALWAADPFLIAHARVIHTDALLTSFMALSLLAALVAFRLDEDAGRYSRPARMPFLVVSAAATGLALLTKSPALVLPPVVGLIALAGHWNAPRFAQRLPLVPLLLWAAVSVAVWVALWPAAWVNPAAAAGVMANEVRGNGAEPHEWGNFFMGRPDPAPGPLFYPVAIAFRLTPWTLAGLLLAVGLLVSRPRRMTLPLLVVAAFTLMFTGALSVLPKKFDRYVLPVFPMLDLLAAVGLLWLADRIGNRWSRLQRSGRRKLSLGLGAIAGAGLALNVAVYHPFELAYYNPLLGGGAVAARTVPVGWGEGLEQVAAYLETQEDRCDLPVAMEFEALLEHAVCNPIVDLGAAGAPDFQGYAVLYVDQLQRNDEPVVTAALLGGESPIHTVRMHGIDYAYVYQIDPKIAHTVTATFGSSLRLKGYSSDTTALATENAVRLTLQWQAAEPLPADTMLFVHLLDGAGGRVGQVDVPMASEHAPERLWKQGRVVTWEQAVPVQPGLTPGAYWLGLGVYSPKDGSRLPLEGPAQPGAPSDGEDALVVGPIQIP